MRPSTVIVAATATLMVSCAAEAAERTVRLAVDRMWCAGCSYIVKTTLASVPGVSEVDVSMAEKAAVVTFDDAETTVAALTQATAGVGFFSHVVGEGGD
jgi:periplasmic mercuric ion binding protein